MLKACVMVIFLLITLQACSEDGYDMPMREVPKSILNNQESIRNGQQLFLRLCRECHGTLGEGRQQRAERFIPPAPDFHESQYAQIDPAYLFWRIQEGKRAEPFRSRGSAMPSWKPHLTEKQIWSLVAYLIQRSRSHH